MAFIDPSAEPIVPGVQQGPINQTPQNLSAPIASGGQGVASGGGKNAQTPGVNVPQQPSAQLSAYINANQPQAAGLASNVAGTVGGQIQNAQNAIQPAVNVYTGQLYNVPTDTATNQQIATAPSQLTPQQQATFQTELGAAANVPNSANTFESTQGYQNLSQQIQGAVQQANLWNAGNNPATLSTALQPFETGNATQGDTTLDALLLSQNPTAYSQIQNAIAPGFNLQSNLTNATTGADQALQAAIQNDQAATTAAQQSAQSYATNLQNYLTQAVQNAQAQGATINAQVLADADSGNLSASDAATLGITPDQAAALNAAAAQANQNIAAANMGAQNINLTNYLTQNPTSSITPANMASAQQYQDVAMLQNLLGANAPTEPITSTTANLAGTGGPDLSTLNYSGAISAANTASQIAQLQQQAEATARAGQYANQQYGINHFGGQSPDQFNSYISGLNNTISSLNSQIQALAANAPGIGTVLGVNAPSGGGGANLQNIALAANPVALLNATLLNPIESVANDIGNFFGFDEGGQIPNLKNYMEAS